MSKRDFQEVSYRGEAKCENKTNRRGGKNPDVSVTELQSALSEGDVGLWKDLCALGWGWSAAKLWAGWKNKFNFIESLLLAEHRAGSVTQFLCSTWRSALCPGLKGFFVQDLYFLAPFELVGGEKGGLCLRLKNFWQFFNIHFVMTLQKDKAEKCNYIFRWKIVSWALRTVSQLSFVALHSSLLKRKTKSLSINGIVIHSNQVIIK